MPRLVAAYQAWKAEGAPAARTFPDEPSWEIVTVDIFRAFSLVLTSLQTLSILKDARRQEFQHSPDTQSINETLVRSGFIGAAPDVPVVAISFQALEAFRQLSRVCPRLSAQAFVKAMCHLHHVSSSFDNPAVFVQPGVIFVGCISAPARLSISYRGRCLP